MNNVNVPVSKRMIVIISACTFIFMVFVIATYAAGCHEVAAGRLIMGNCLKNIARKNSLFPMLPIAIGAVIQEIKELRTEIKSRKAD